MAWYRCGTSGGRTPSKGTPYLFSYGVQSVQLPITGEKDYTYKFKLFVSTPNQGLVFGGAWAVSSKLLHVYDSNLTYYINNNPISVTYDACKPIEIEASTDYITVNGITYTATPSARAAEPIYLFGFSGNYRTSHIGLSEMKIYDNSDDSLVMDLVPMVNPNGEGYFYDTVGSTSYYSDTSTPLSYVLLDGSNIIANLKLNEGLLNVRTGEITADSDYYYSEPFPCPMTSAFFDVGESQQVSSLGFEILDANGDHVEYFTANARYREVSIISYIPNPTGYTCRLSFAKSHIKDVMLRDISANIIYSADTPIIVGEDQYQWATKPTILQTKTITENGTYSAQDDGVLGYSEVTVDVKEYVDITSFAHYFKRNTSTPIVTQISNYEYSLSFQDQNATNYEMSSYSVSLTKGVYVAEIYATVDKNTGIASQYTWGIYSCNSGAGAQRNDADPRTTSWTTYVPIDRTDTNEHYYEVPINVTADGTAYICFTMGDDNNQNATVTVRSLKIRKV